MSELDRLNPRQGLFVRHYLETGNAAKSARLAGFSPASSNTQGYKLLRNPRILKELERQRLYMEAEAGCSRWLVVFKLLEIIETNPMESVVVLGEGRNEHAIVTTTTGDRLRAMQMLSKIMGYDAPVKVDHTVSRGLSAEGKAKLMRDVLGIGPADEDEEREDIVDVDASVH